MITSLTIREHNKQPHYDIDEDLLKKRNGLFTFVLRINNGNIVDYCVLESKNYAGKTKTKPVAVSRDNRK